MGGFYVSICTVCNCGLDGDRYAREHSNEECREFQRLRKHYKVPGETRIDQLDFLKALAFEKVHKRLPEIGEK